MVGTSGSDLNLKKLSDKRDGVKKEHFLIRWKEGYRYILECKDGKVLLNGKKVEEGKKKKIKSGDKLAINDITLEYEEKSVE